MTDWLLDTNVVSELARPRPDGRVLRFLSDIDSTYLSVITIHELNFGSRRASGSRQRAELGAWLNALEDEYSDWILPIERTTAAEAARLRADAAEGGRTVQLADALIAGTAIQHRLTIATRNTKNFNDQGLAAFDPWSG